MKEEQGTTVASVALPPTGMFNGKRYHTFQVPAEIFRKFETGRNKFERWSKYLNLEDEAQQSIYQVAKRRPQDTIILQCSSTGAIRSIRRRSANGL